ncbi:hypothetical protein ADUPG1_000767, partial [Aduncisulcus paluster]
LSYNSISDPSLISSLPAFENLSHISLDNNEVSDISFLSTIVDSIDRLSYMNVSKNLLDCGDSDECFILLDDISTKDMKDDGTTVVFGTQDTTSTCGSEFSSCDFLVSHEVCSFSSSGTEECKCAGEYYLDSSNHCMPASYVPNSTCSGCGGNRGECSYSSDLSTATCECYDGWYGDDCFSACPLSSGLSPLICSGDVYGSCDTATHTCVCVVNYIGSACEFYCNDLENCGEHGYCDIEYVSSEEDGEIVISEELTCTCDEGWYGSKCQSEYPVEIIVGEDEDGNPTHTCVCVVNYIGSTCEFYCNDLENCGEHGYCDIEYVSSEEDGEIVISEELTCTCDEGWYGSKCQSEYPVEIIVGEDEDGNRIKVDYVCGKDHSSVDSDYSYLADPDILQCDCNSYGYVFLDSGLCIDPATHPDYKDIGENSTVCLTCGLSDESHGACIFVAEANEETNESELHAKCECEFGWGEDPYHPELASCSTNVCILTYDEGKYNILDECSSHGYCEVSSYSSICECDGGYRGVSCELKIPIKIPKLYIFIGSGIAFIIIMIIVIVATYRRLRDQKSESSKEQDGPVPSVYDLPELVPIESSSSESQMVEQELDIADRSGSIHSIIDSDRIIKHENRSATHSGTPKLNPITPGVSSVRIKDTGSPMAISSGGSSGVRRKVRKRKRRVPMRTHVGEFSPHVMESMGSAGIRPGYLFSPISMTSPVPSSEQQNSDSIHRVVIKNL